MIPLSQVLADLQVSDGMEISPGDAADIVRRVQTKLAAISTRKGPTAVDFVDPVVTVESGVDGTLAARLRISASPAPPAAEAE